VQVICCYYSYLYSYTLSAGLCQGGSGWWDVGGVGRIWTVDSRMWIVDKI
jgi:hypothetical protein